MNRNIKECSVEAWLDLEQYPNHQVSTFGRVRNKKNNHILKHQLDRYGYPKLSIGSKDNVPIHRLVCQAVYGKPIGKRNQVNHIDCDRQNNKANNLEWVTSSENIKWGVDHGNIDPYKGLKRANEVNKQRYLKRKEGVKI